MKRIASFLPLLVLLLMLIAPSFAFAAALQPAAANAGGFGAQAVFLVAHEVLFSGWVNGRENRGGSRRRWRSHGGQGMRY